MNFAELGKLLENMTGKWGILYTLIDKNDRIIMSSRQDAKIMEVYDRRPAGEHKQLSGSIILWTPPMRPNVTVMERWSRSLYVSEVRSDRAVPWTLVLEEPLAPFQKTLNEVYAKGLAQALGLFLVAIVIGTLLSKRMVASFSALSEISSACRPAYPSRRSCIGLKAGSARPTG